MLKKEIRAWTLDFKRLMVGLSKDLKSKLCDIDKVLDQGGVTDDILLSRLEVLKQLHDVQSSNNRDIMQKAKIRWAIEGDENSKYFHAIINKKRANLSVKGIMVDGDWIVEPDLILELESPISNEDIRIAVWGCGVDKSPGPDGFTFEFFRKYWTVVGPDFCIAVKWFFDHGVFAYDAIFVCGHHPKVLASESWGPLAPFLFLLIMESLHLSFSRAVEAGIFKGYKIDPSTTLSHLFYADDAKVIFLGSVIPDNCVAEAAKFIGCLIMKAPFKYLGILVGDNMSSKKAWDETINKMKKRLSRNFFNGIQEGDRKIAWVKWSKVLASKNSEALPWLNGHVLSAAFNSTWSSIITEVNSLKVKGGRLFSLSNLSRRNVSLPSLACPLCDHVLEDSSHLFFGCSVAKDIQKLICRWWNLDVHPYESYEIWLICGHKSYPFSSKTERGVGRRVLRFLVEP
ncbi:RNA-directed DNA polymerase, eukaryota [Tanacetum coccineum]